MLTFLKDQPKVDLCMDCLKDKYFVERFLLDSRIYKADNLSTTAKLLSIEHPAETLENTLALVTFLLEEKGSELSPNFCDNDGMATWAKAVPGEFDVVNEHIDDQDRQHAHVIMWRVLHNEWKKPFSEYSLLNQTPIVLLAANSYIEKWKRSEVLGKTHSTTLDVYADNLKQKWWLWFWESRFFSWDTKWSGTIGSWGTWCKYLEMQKAGKQERDEWFDNLSKSSQWSFLPTKDLIKELGFDVKPTLNLAVVELFKKDKAKYYKFGEENKPKGPRKLQVRVSKSEINKIAGEDPTAEHLQEVLKDLLAQHAKRKGLSIADVNIKDVNVIPPKVTGAAAVSVGALKTVEGNAATKSDPRIDVLANHLNSINEQPGVGVGDVATFISGRDRQIKGRDASGNNIYRNADTEVLWKAIARYFEDEIPIPVGRIVRGKNRGEEKKLIQVHPKCQEFIELWPKGALKECRWEKPPEKKGRWSGQTYKIFHGNTGNRADPQRLAAWLVQNMDIDMYVRTWESRKAA